GPPLDVVEEGMVRQPPARRATHRAGTRRRQCEDAMTKDAAPADHRRNRFTSRTAK
ncbi:MAG: hypothetical protein JWO81_1531, partial [Alphaproteobacteria bacterium]|nr:hypothetical protein [Alphaproteobacteria bacterium]